MNKLPSIRKILQALYYLQSKAPRENKDRFNRVYLLKMLYVSDRYHLRHFGNLISDDNYLAMRLGPVASVASDVLKKNQYNINSAAVYYLSAVRELSEHEVEIEPQGDDELSESAKEALDFALKEFGRYSWIEQSAISHCYPEWKNHETELSYANPSVPMKLQDFFDDPDDDACFVAFNKNCDPFKDDKDFLALLKEDFNTNATPF